MNPGASCRGQRRAFGDEGKETEVLALRGEKRRKGAVALNRERVRISADVFNIKTIASLAVFILDFNYSDIFNTNSTHTHKKKK